MSFLLDTDICSAFLKNDPRVVSRAMLHFGSLHLSTITIGELLTWARRAKAPPARTQGVEDFISAAIVHDVDYMIADRFGTERARLLDQGTSFGEMDLLNASVALVHQLVMVTHNTKDYAMVPGLILVDWLLP